MNQILVTAIKNTRIISKTIAIFFFETLQATEATTIDIYSQRYARTRRGECLIRNANSNRDQHLVATLTGQVIFFATLIENAMGSISGEGVSIRVDRNIGAKYIFIIHDF